MAGSSCTRHLRCPSRTTPTANAIDVIRTSPSGTIGTRAATMPISESRTPSWEENSWL